MRNNLLEKKGEKERKRREILMKEREKELERLKRLKEEEKREHESLKEKRRNLKERLNKKKAVKQKIPFFKIFKKEKLPPLPPLPKELFIKTGKLKIKLPKEKYLPTKPKKSFFDAISEMMRRRKEELEKKKKEKEKMRLERELQKFFEERKRSQLMKQREEGKLKRLEAKRELEEQRKKKKEGEKRERLMLKKQKKTFKEKIKLPTFTEKLFIKKQIEPKLLGEIESKREIEEAIEKVKQKPAKIKLSALQFIKNGIYDARDALTDLDLKRARHIYIEIMAHYNELKDKDKAKVYEDIKELYEGRKHAESIFGKK